LIIDDRLIEYISKIIKYTDFVKNALSNPQYQKYFKAHQQNKKVKI
jgi:hypothetical protein